MLKAVAYNRTNNNTMTTEGIEGLTPQQIADDLRTTASFEPDGITIIETSDPSGQVRETYHRGVNYR
jgi:hypothetical protein